MSDVTFTPVTHEVTSATVSKDFTVSGMGQCVAAVVEICNASAIRTSTAHVQSSRGYYVEAGEAQKCIGITVLDNVGTSVTSRAGSSDKILVIPVSSGSSVFTEWTASSITDGIRLTIGSQALTTTARITVTFIYGDDVLNAKLGGAVSGSGTGPWSVYMDSKGVDTFEPTVVMAMSVGVGGSYPDFEASGANINYGYVVNAPTIKERCCSWRSGNNETTMKEWCYYGPNLLVEVTATGTLEYTFNIAAFNSNGFTYTASNSNGADELFWYLALEFTAGTEVEIHTGTISRSASTYSISGMGFEPAMMISNWVVADTYNTIEASVTGIMATYINSDGVESSLNGCSLDGVTTSNSGGYWSDNWRITRNDPSLSVTSGTLGFTSSGFSVPTISNAPSGVAMAWVGLFMPKGTRNMKIGDDSIVKVYEGSDRILSMYEGADQLY